MGDVIRWRPCYNIWCEGDEEVEDTNLPSRNRNPGAECWSQWKLVQYFKTDDTQKLFTGEIPSKNVKLSDFAVFKALLELSSAERTLFTADFNSRGSIRDRRPATGRPAVALANGTWHYIVVEQGYQLHGDDGERRNLSQRKFYPFNLSQWPRLGDAVCQSTANKIPTTKNLLGHSIDHAQQQPCPIFWPVADNRVAWLDPDYTVCEVIPELPIVGTPVRLRPPGTPRSPPDRIDYNGIAANSPAASLRAASASSLVAGTAKKLPREPKLKIMFKPPKKLTGEMISTNEEPEQLTSLRIPTNLLDLVTPEPDLKPPSPQEPMHQAQQNALARLDHQSAQYTQQLPHSEHGNGHHQNEPQPAPTAQDVPQPAGSATVLVPYKPEPPGPSIPPPAKKRRMHLDFAPVENNVMPATIGQFAQTLDTLF
ncbi:MAG: hypothetical protein Q9167_002737 [Letrouitia subvulpina]